MFQITAENHTFPSSPSTYLRSMVSLTQNEWPNSRIDISRLIAGYSFKLKDLENEALTNSNLGS